MRSMRRGTPDPRRVPVASAILAARAAADATQNALLAAWRSATADSARRLVHRILATSPIRSLQSRRREAALRGVRPPRTASPDGASSSSPCSTPRGRVRAPSAGDVVSTTSSRRWPRSRLACPSGRECGSTRLARSSARLEAAADDARRPRPAPPMLERRPARPRPAGCCPASRGRTGAGRRACLAAAGTRRFGAALVAAATVLLALAAVLRRGPADPAPAPADAARGRRRVLAEREPGRRRRRSRPRHRPSHDASRPTTAPLPRPSPPTRSPSSPTRATGCASGPQPGVGADSTKLKPLLTKGTRMLIVDGPVSVDGYDWYEVRVADEDSDRLRLGRGGQGRPAWIKNADPPCADEPNADLDQALILAIEYLACYGDAQVQVTAHVERLSGRHRRTTCGGRASCSTAPGARRGSSNRSASASRSARRRT